MLKRLKPDREKKKADRGRLFIYSLFIIFCYLLIPVFGRSVEQDSVTTLFLVRHAEKAESSSNDPELTAEGQQRAEELNYFLKHVDIVAIYSTPFKRTNQTALPTARDKNLEIQIYAPNDRKFLENVLLRHSGGTVLIVGHSNTIPGLANELAGRKEYDDLDDTIYDNLFIAHIGPNQQTKVIRVRFGAHTPEKQIMEEP